MASRTSGDIFNYNQEDMLASGKPERSKSENLLNGSDSLYFQILNALRSVLVGLLFPPGGQNAKQETDQDTDGATYQALDPIPGGHAPRVISLHHILPGSRGHYY